jgi:hypothetical protein
MQKRILYFFLVLLFLADVGYSFLQHYSQPLDGDMAWAVVPAVEVKPILESPLGIRAIVNNETYANPNRFFCQYSYREFLMNVPLFLQNWKSPIDSVYLASAIMKIIVQLLLILLLATAITGSTNVLKLDFMIAAVLVTPLFQTNGYRSIMGIIDPSPTYVFFYALPAALLIIYFLPLFFKQYFNAKPSLEIIIKILWIPLAFVVCLSGPLNPGIVLVISLLMFLHFLIRNVKNTHAVGFYNTTKNAFYKIPGDYWFYLLPVSILSLYSLFLGRYNSITITTQIPVIEMYLRIPEGIFLQFTRKLGFPLLFVLLLLNTILIGTRYKSKEGAKILNIFKWIGIFSLIYILLLPLGGYREYRYYILRYDTILPITLGLVFIFGISTLYLFNKMKKNQLFWYSPIIILALFIFTNADEPEFDNNQCEKSALQELGYSNQDTVVLQYNCNVVEWIKVETPERSELNASLFQIWGITKEKKLYYQE